MADNIEDNEIFGIHDWVVFHGLTRSLKYNNKIGIIIELIDNKAIVQLLASKNKVTIQTKNLRHLRQYFSYTKDGRMKKFKVGSESEQVKSSKYTRLVNFLYNLFRAQESPPILIGNNRIECNNSIQYWTIPGIGQFGKVAMCPISIARGQMFVRLPDSCLIESLLARDIEALVEVVKHQNRYYHGK